jgi:hypothetical protein
MRVRIFFRRVDAKGVLHRYAVGVDLQAQKTGYEDHENELQGRGESAGRDGHVVRRVRGRRGGGDGRDGVELFAPRANKISNVKASSTRAEYLAEGAVEEAKRQC